MNSFLQAYLAKQGVPASGVPESPSAGIQPSGAGAALGAAGGALSAIGGAMGDDKPEAPDAKATKYAAEQMQKDPEVVGAPAPQGPQGGTPSKGFDLADLLKTTTKVNLGSVL